MRIYFLALTIIVVLGILLSINVEARTTTFSEKIQCQQSSNCKSVFEITEGSNVRLTISVPTQDEIKFKVENPNGKDVRLIRSSFPDSVGMTQIFTRTMSADITGEYTLSFLEPLPKDFKADISVVIDSAESVKIQDIPAAGTPNQVQFSWKDSTKFTISSALQLLIMSVKIPYSRKPSRFR